MKVVINIVAEGFKALGQKKYNKAALYLSPIWLSAVLIFIFIVVGGVGVAAQQAQEYQQAQINIQATRTMNAYNANITATVMSNNTTATVVAWRATQTPLALMSLLKVTDLEDHLQTGGWALDEYIIFTLTNYTNIPLSISATNYTDCECWNDECPWMTGQLGSGQSEHLMCYNNVMDLRYYGTLYISGGGSTWCIIPLTGRIWSC